MDDTDRENVDRYSSIKLSTNPSQKEEVTTEIRETISSKLASRGRTALEPASVSLFSAFSITSLLAMIAIPPKIYQKDFISHNFFFFCKLTNMAAPSIQKGRENPPRA